MPDAFSGFVEGFQGHQEEQYKRNYEQDAARRQQEGEIFKYLLQSNDPDMRALAMSGLFESAQPGKRKKGLAGAMGEIQSGEFYPLVRARMNEMVPDQPAAPATQPTPPAAPGSAAMSTNQPVRPGASPISQVPAPPAPSTSLSGMGPTQADNPLLGPQPGAQGVPMPPPPSVESKWKRRGTGVPTAEEIAEHTNQVELENKIKTISGAILTHGGTPEDVKRAVMGMVGAPPALDTTANGPVLASPQDPETPIPTVRHRDGSITLIDGTQPPAGLVGYVKPTAGGRVTKTMRDPASPTGYSAVTYVVDGTPNGQELMRVPTEFIPPPAFAGTTEINEPGTNVPVRATIPRGGGAPVPIGDAPGTRPSQTENDAKALLDIVNKRVAEQRRPGLPVRPGARDQITQEEARKLNLPFTTFAEVERAARSTPEVTPREQAAGGSLAERVRARALQNRAGGQGGAPAEATPLPPPPPIPGPSQSNRARGAGPVR